MPGHAVWNAPGSRCKGRAWWSRRWCVYGQNKPRKARQEMQKVESGERWHGVALFAPGSLKVYTAGGKVVGWSQVLTYSHT